MLTKDVKAFIKSIRNHEDLVVESMLATFPDLIVAKAKSPPKNDDGQSMLQISFKCGNFAAAQALIKMGSDSNFIEESNINEWKAPVLHDAIRATIFNCKTIKPDDSDFTLGIRLLRQMLINGADPNKRDSYGNNSGIRAVLDSRQMIINQNCDSSENGTVSQLRLIFSLLNEFGADFISGNEKRDSVSNTIKTMGLSDYNLLPA